MFTIGLGGCQDLCPPSTMSAASRIIGAWCERNLQCDPTAAQVKTCVAERIAMAHVRDDDACCACCAEEDSFDCVRSTCDEDEVDQCVEQVHAMECSALSDPGLGLVRYPSGCDSCF